jgi:hypothetical protein
MFVTNKDDPSIFNIEVIHDMLVEMKTRNSNGQEFTMTPLSHYLKILGDLSMNTSALAYCSTLDIQHMFGRAPSIKNVCITATDRNSNAIAIELLKDTDFSQESDIENFYVVCTAKGLISLVIQTDLTKKNERIKRN